jgi:5'(3')-deoxyribonucleotidase
VNDQAQKRIIVDIDNTLWNLAPVLWEHLKALNPKIPPPPEWSYWDFWQEFVTTKDLYQVLRNIHMQQEKYTPYPESKPFLEALKKRDFYIIIASHRERKTLNPTVNWLKQNGLLFDEVHLSHDKSVLFADSWAIIDDSPITLDKATKAGIGRVGLLNPWNANSAHPLFDNLFEVLRYIESLDGQPKPCRSQKGDKK